jgi:hypothetical protein
MMSYLPRNLPEVIQIEKKMFVKFDWNNLLETGIVALDGIHLRFTQSVRLKYIEGLTYACLPVSETEHMNDRIVYVSDFSALVNRALTPLMMNKDWTEFFTTRAHLVPLLPVADSIKHEVSSWIFRGDYTRYPFNVIFDNWEDFEKAHRVFQVPITNIIHRIGTHLKHEEFYGAVYPVKSIVHSRKKDTMPIPSGVHRLPGLKFVLTEVWVDESDS